MKFKPFLLLELMLAFFLSFQSAFAASDKYKLVWMDLSVMPDLLEGDLNNDDDVNRDDLSVI